MLHQEIDPKAVLARLASERVIAAQAAAHRTKFDPRALGSLARRRHVTLMMKDGRIVEGLLYLGTTERLCMREDGSDVGVWLNTSDVADADF